MYLRIVTLLVFLIAFFSPGFVASLRAQSEWDICPNGATIVRCETYNCPQGDTNGDGSCTLSDNGASLTSARNDSLCANPISGCGEVRYYGAGGQSACGVRVKQDLTNCNLYNPGDPDSSPIPRVGESPSPLPTTTTTPTPSPSPSPFISCNALNAEPGNVDSVPFDVSFTSSVIGDVENYRFDFGDGSSPITLSRGVIVHRYSEPGVYTASLQVAGEDGEFKASSSCRAVVNVGETGATTKGGEPIDELPETGSPILYVVGIAGFGALGVFIFERYRFA